MRRRTLNGDQLLELREKLGIEMTAMASALGLTTPAYRMIEDDDAEVPRHVAFTLFYMEEHPEARPRQPSGQPRSVSAQEMVRLAVSAPRGLYDGRTWGRWRFTEESLTLDLNSRASVVDRDQHGQEVIERTEDYYVTLYEITRAEHVLDWIGQIAGKGWGSAVVGDFALALDDIFHFQGHFGRGHSFNGMNEARAYLKSRLGTAPSQLDEED